MRQSSSILSLTDIANKAWWVSVITLTYLVHGVHTGSPIVPRWAAIYALAIGCLIWLAYHAIKGRKLTLSVSEICVLGFLAYCALTLAWSSDWRDGLLTIEGMFALIIIYMGFRRLEPQTQRQIIAVSSVMAVAFGLAFGWGHQEIYGGFGNENFQAEWFLIVLPFLIWTWFSGRHGFLMMRLAALVLTPITLYFILFINLSDSKYVALGATLFLVCIWIWRRIGFLWAGIVFMVPINIAIFSGWLTSPVIQKSIAHRLEIAINTGLMWLEKPIFGQGLGSFNFEYGRFQEAHLQWFPDMGTVLYPSSVFAGAAHMEALQLAAETGIIGLAAAVVLIAILLRASLIVREPGDLIAAAIVSLVIAAGLSCIGFPLQNPAAVMAVVLAAGIVMEKERACIIMPALTTRKIVPVFSIGFALVLTASMSWHYAAERKFAIVNLYIEKNEPTALAANIQTHQLFPFEPRYRRQLVMTAGALLKNAHGRVQITDAAADEAYRISLTTGHLPAIKLVRLEYLLNTGRWERRKEEVEEILAFLKQHSSLQPSVWIADGTYGIFTNDGVRALKAVMQGMELPEARYHASHFEKILAGLNIESETIQ